MNAPRDLLLIVDDEFLITQGLCAQVEALNMAVCATASTADEAIELARMHRPSIALMDVRLQGEKDGVDAAMAIHPMGIKVIFITGSREPATMKRIQQDHPAAVLFKPISDRQLKAAIDTAMELIRSEAQPQAKPSPENARGALPLAR